MTTINIQYDDKQVRRALRRLLRAGADMSPVMRRIATKLQASAEQNFDKETAPDGKPWAKLKPYTVKQRQKSGHVPIKILTRDADLKRSILADWSKTEAIAGTNIDYAAQHQFGAEKGEFGTTKDGKPVPLGDIPARPFLGVSEADRDDIRDLITDYIAERWA